MKTLTCTKEQALRNFSREVFRIYEQGKIHSPVHLSGGNEKALINIFRKIRKGDWILSTYRSHYHWLLSRRSKKELLRQIKNNCSMHISGKQFITSSIVAGCTPIALGIAYALKKRGNRKKVWCFIGDMAARTGLAMECMKYASGHNLPVTYVVEDNGLSVTTLTREVWGNQQSNKVLRYFYKRIYPHAGTGKFVLF